MRIKKCIPWVSVGTYTGSSICLKVGNMSGLQEPIPHPPPHPPVRIGPSHGELATWLRHVWYFRFNHLKSLPHPPNLQILFYLGFNHLKSHPPPPHTHPHPHIYTHNWTIGTSHGELEHCGDFAVNRKVTPFLDYTVQRSCWVLIYKLEIVLSLKKAIRMWVSKRHVSVSDEWPLFKYVKEKVVSKVVAQMICLMEYFGTNSPCQIIITNRFLQEPKTWHLATNGSTE